MPPRPDRARRRRLRWPMAAVAAASLGAVTLSVVVGTQPSRGGSEPAPAAAPEATDPVSEDAAPDPGPAPGRPPATPDPVVPLTSAGIHAVGDAAEPESAAPDDAAPDDAAPDEAEERELSTTEVQRRLRDLRYLIGPADGAMGQQTVAAVMAFQRVHGLEVDGVVGPITTAALLGPTTEPELVGGDDDRIEVDLDHQLLHLVEGGERVVTLHVSSGNGTPYVATSGNDVTADTPVGDFRIERRHHGVREANLGVLHDPMYFHRGFAIHGAPSVPATPASLGCVRVSIADGAWLIDRVADGTSVHLHGGEHVYRPPGH